MGPISIAAWGVLLALAAFVVTDAGRDAAATTTIEGTDVKWEVYDHNRNQYRWVMPVTTYENEIVDSRLLVREPLEVSLDGETIRTVSLDGFVKRSFLNIIDAVYRNSDSNADFIWAVWHIVSQLTVYDEDIYEYSEGRYALETLTRSGGDCEDLVILIADMLMSSRYTDHWTFQYVYMDADNPRDPQTINHMILYVHDGEYNYFIEATATPSWNHYPDGVVGWYIDVVTYDEADLSWNLGGTDNTSLSDELAAINAALDGLVAVVDSMIVTAESTSEPPRLDDLYLLLDALYGLSAAIAFLQP